MTKQHKGCVAVITGAASGIGFALAQACVQEGAHVVMADCAADALSEKVNTLSSQAQSEVLGVVCDVTHIDSVAHLAKQTYAHFKRVDWLFNNAGVSGHLQPVWEMTPEQLRTVMDVNVFGVFNGIRTFLPYLFEQTHASHIINTASIYSLISGSQLSAYAMSKHALLALSESLHYDLKRLNKRVQISIACPSFVSTPLIRHSMPPQGSALHDLLDELIHRSRSPEEIAACILRDMQRGVFYILPDREAMTYTEQRTKAILEQSLPPEHSLEKLLSGLCRRIEPV